MLEFQLDSRATDNFTTSLIKCLQQLCHRCMNFDSNIEVMGYINVNVDSGSKADFVLCEKLLKSSSNSTTFVSNSFLAKKDEYMQPNKNCSQNAELCGRSQHATRQLPQSFHTKHPSQTLHTVVRDCNISCKKQRQRRSSKKAPCGEDRVHQSISPDPIFTRRSPVTCKTYDSMQQVISIKKELETSGDGLGTGDSCEQKQFSEIDFPAELHCLLPPDNDLNSHLSVGSCQGDSRSIFNATVKKEAVPPLPTSVNIQNANQVSVVSSNDVAVNGELQIHLSSAHTTAMEEVASTSAHSVPTTCATTTERKLPEDNIFCELDMDVECHDTEDKSHLVFSHADEESTDDGYLARSNDIQIPVKRSTGRNTQSWSKIALEALSSADSCHQYRQNITKDKQMDSSVRQRNKQQAKTYKRIMSEERRKRYNEMARVRNAKCRARKKAALMAATYAAACREGEVEKKRESTSLRDSQLSSVSTFTPSTFDFLNEIWSGLSDRKLQNCDLKGENLTCSLPRTTPSEAMSSAKRCQQYGENGKDLTTKYRKRERCRKHMSEEQRKRYNEQARVRNARCRAKKKAAQMAAATLAVDGEDEFEKRKEKDFKWRKWTLLTDDEKEHIIHPGMANYSIEKEQVLDEPYFLKTEPSDP